MERYTRGFGTPQEVVERRDKFHHMNSQGFGKAQVHSALVNVGLINGYSAMRGREQQLIDALGGAKSDPARSPNSICANLIRGVAKNNFAGQGYHLLSNLMFGTELAPYTGGYKIKN